MFIPGRPVLVQHAPANFQAPNYPAGAANVQALNNPASAANPEAPNNSAIQVIIPARIQSIPQ